MLYPDSFRALLRAWRESQTPPPPAPRNGKFVTSREQLVLLNSAIGEEQWGDLERAFAGKTQPKDGNKLWGGLLPFWYETSRRARKSPLGRRAGNIVLGFDVDAPLSDRVLVWSVHTLVHDYPNVRAWLDDEARRA